MMKNLFARLRKQSGSAELIMVMGMAVVGLVVMSSNLTLFDDLNKKNRLERETLGAKDLKDELEVFLSLQVNCDATFDSVAIDNTTKTAAIKNQLNDIFKVGTQTQYMNNLFTIKSWRLRDDPTAAPISPTQKIVNLEVEMEKVSTTSIGPRNLIRTIKLVTTYAANQVVDCYALKGGGNELWVNAADPDEIINTTFGSIGVGVPSDHTYTHKFEVRGDGFLTHDLLPGGVIAAQNRTVTPSGGDINVAGMTSFMGNLGIGQAATGAKISVNGDGRTSGTTTVAANHLLLANSALVSGNIPGVQNITVAGTTALSGSLTTSGKFDTFGASNFLGSTIFNRPVRYSTLTIGSTTPSADPLHVAGNAEVETSVRSVSLESTRLCIGANCRTTFAQQSCAGGLITQQNADGTVECAYPTCAGSASYYRSLASAPYCTTIPTTSCPVNQYIYQMDPATGARQCRTIPPEVQVPTCPAGQVMLGVNGGVAQCAQPKIPGGTCAPTEVLVGVTTTGSPICRAPANTAMTCSPGQHMLGYNVAGVPICSFHSAVTCGPAQVLRGINNDGSPICGAFTIPAQNCPAGQVVTAVNSAGIISCGAPAVTPSCSVIPNTSLTGAGGPAAPSGCNCVVAGEVFNGSQCVPNCPYAGTSLNGSGGAAYPAGCECSTVGYTWNSSTFQCVPPPPTPNGCWQNTANYVDNTTINPGGYPSATTNCMNGINGSCYIGDSCEREFKYGTNEYTCVAGPCASNSTPGTCGTANGTTVASAPSSGHCSSGTYSGISGSGPWTWSCNGVNGGSSENCSAALTPVAVNGSCGPATGVSSSTAPASGHCNSGTYSGMTNTNPWTWTCNGANGGSSPTCTAPYTAPTGVSCQAGYAAVCRSAGASGLMAAEIDNNCTSSSFGLYQSMDSMCARSSAPSPSGGYDYTCQQCGAPPPPPPVCAGNIITLPQIFLCSGPTNNPGVTWDPAGEQICRNQGHEPWSESWTGDADKYNPVCCQTSGGSCPAGASAGGAGVAINGSCRCNLATDTWDGSTCQTYAQECAAGYAFNNGNINAAVCENNSSGEPPSALGFCQSPYYSDLGLPGSTCTYGGTAYPVSPCTRCGPGSNIPAGYCAVETRCN